MCGICGKLYHDGRTSDEGELLDRMTAALAHRGPDGQGRYMSGPVALGHTRLAIIDLTRGAQPIANEDGTVWIVFNGEIYNFRELRADLVGRGHRFSTDSDTEVIVHLYEEHGVDCLQRLRGMFAFALWDSKQQVLFCARDRVGIKPLYYVDTGHALVFASEVKALLTDPQVQPSVDHQAIDTFLTFTYGAGSDTLLRPIRKLEPGHYLTSCRGRTVVRPYWNLTFPRVQRPCSFGEAAEALRELIKNTVRDHMISDVPVGVLLSGGIDSTVILSCAAAETSRPIQTFTVGFSGADFEDERPYAELAARRFGAEHRSITVSSQDYLGALERYIWHMEEPVSEPPAIALDFVSRLARQHVKVVLSGEGGDEAFGGYETYRNLALLERVKSSLGAVGSAGLSAVVAAAGRLGDSRRLRKYSPLLKVPLSSYYFSRRSSPFAFFPRLRREFYTDDMNDRIVAGHPSEMIDAHFQNVKEQGHLNQMLYVDTKTWLTDDLLVKADKITMANSLELRVPLLDHQVLEFAAALPPHFKVSGMSTKRVLKKAFAGHIPEEILRRRKQGFPVPIGRWLRGDFKEYVHDLLLSDRSIGRGYFRREAVESLLRQCGAGQQVVHEVFCLLALELWHRRFVDIPASR